MVSYADVGAASQAAYHAQLETLQREFARQSAFLFAFLSNMSPPHHPPSNRIAAPCIHPQTQTQARTLTP